MKAPDIQFCDFCEITQDNAHQRVGKYKCAICGRWACDSTVHCKGGFSADMRGTLPGLFGHGYPFVCGYCIESAGLIFSREGFADTPKVGKLAKSMTELIAELEEEFDTAYIDEIENLIIKGVQSES